MNAKSSRYKIDLLEGVRGILAVWVMLGYFLLFLGIVSTPYPLLSKTTLYLTCYSSIPVLLFMTLSGFVIMLLLNIKQELYLI